MYARVEMRHHILGVEVSLWFVTGCCQFVTLSCQIHVYVLSRPPLLRRKVTVVCGGVLSVREGQIVKGVVMYT